MSQCLNTSVAGGEVIITTKLTFHNISCISHARPAVWLQQYVPSVGAALLEAASFLKHYNSREGGTCLWEQVSTEYFLKELHLEGHGSLTTTPCSCKCLYHCEDCYGPEISCKSCCLLKHAHHPLHIINKWNGTHFEHNSLVDMGPRVQLGHEGMPCLHPQRGHVSFVMIHTNAIHQQLLHCEWYLATLHFPQSACTRQSSKVSGYEFYASLKRLTDNTGLNVPKSWYKKFMRMVCQFHHIKLMKQAGHGNITGGIHETEPGALTTKCPACLQPAVNLLEDWDKVEGSMKFLYYLIITMYANFCLKNRNQSSSMADPGLHTGLAYFVPDKSYTEHVLRNASQADVVTGIGLCLCTHHEYVQPQGVGDLQKGEEYANMDFIFFSSIMPLLLLSVVISYDIACQWKLNLMKRMNGLPEHLQMLATVTLAAFIFGIHKFHCPAHKEKCAIPHSLNLMPGIGWTDGEGIKCNWAEINHVANSMKEMGAGY
ncbi:hypothetical protein BDR06DRAFT_1032018 [Suillus hirtellus]|nr:hypothetical protein BDR06DRAFT_1032018 [Suillus hirtellus]